MEIYITDESLNDILTVDTARSVIWHSKYCGEGDFELYIQADREIMQSIREGCFAWNEDSRTVMIVEKIIPKTDIENGDYLLISGRSAEGILARRIVWSQTNLNGVAQDEVLRLIRENVTEPDDTERAIPLIMQGETVDSQEKIERQLCGEELLSCVTEILSSCGMGFELEKRNHSLYFNIKTGSDRSEGNLEGNAEVVFSEEFDSLLTSEYIRDYTEYKNVALVAGEGEGTARKTSVSGAASGLARREMYIESSASTNDGKIDDGSYRNMLSEEGKAVLLEKKMSETFNGEVVPDGNFILGKDYFLGDLVTIKNEYGISAKVRVTEITENRDENGYNLVISYESV